MSEMLVSVFVIFMQCLLGMSGYIKDAYYSNCRMPGIFLAINLWLSITIWGFGLLYIFTGKKICIRILALCLIIAYTWASFHGAIVAGKYLFSGRY